MRQVKTYYEVSCIRLRLVNSLQLVESSLTAGEIEFRWLLHQAKLGVEVLELVGIA